MSQLYIFDYKLNKMEHQVNQVYAMLKGIELCQDVKIVIKETHTFYQTTRNGKRVRVCSTCGIIRDVGRRGSRTNKTVTLT